MPRTPDRFPGEREDEGVILEPSSITPVVNGEIRYVTGVGFRFYEEGVEKGLAGSGITGPQHESLDTLVHELDETSYEEVTYGTGSNPSSWIVWTSNAKTLKIREEQYTYLSSGRVSQVVAIQYDGSGSEVMRTTEVYTYVNGRVSSIQRTKVP